MNAIERAEKIAAILTKHDLAIRAIRAMAKSGCFTSKEINQSLDLLLGFRTVGEELEVRAHLDPMVPGLNGY